MNTLNIAVWTVGEHARRNILPAISMSKSVNLVGMFTRNIEVLTSQSEQYGCYTYNSSDELLQDSNVDAVYISSPNALHYEQVKQCLLNNKHVVVEKSALSSLSEACSIIDLAKDRGLLVMEAFMFLYHRQFSDLKKLVKSEKYGKMLFVESNFGFPHLSKDDIRYSKELAGGALNDAGAYTICAILDLLGPDSELIFSDLNTEDGYNVDTSGIAVFESSNVKAICKWAMGGSYKNSITIWCENGHIDINRAFSKPENYDTKITVSCDGQIAESIISGKNNHFVSMFQVLVNLVQKNKFNKQYAFLLNQATVVQKIRKKTGVKSETSR
jgi:dTDP-3,4-didehydro-2,6-dideoxy-alpha-D-glucose 3-reductase